MPTLSTKKKYFVMPNSLLLLVFSLIHCDSVGKIQPVDNYMKRVIAKDGLNVREQPNLESKKVGIIPFGKSIWIRKEFTKALEIQGVTGKWLYVDADFGYDAAGKPRPLLKGWIFGAFLGDLEMPLPNGFKSFKAGCIGGCNVCGAYVFDPDGLYLRSFNCHQPPEIGKWVLDDDIIISCSGPVCTPSQKTRDSRFYYVDQTGKITEEHAGQILELPGRMHHWESGGWEDIPERNQNLKPPF